MMDARLYNAAMKSHQDLPSYALPFREETAQRNFGLPLGIIVLLYAFTAPSCISMPTRRKIPEEPKAAEIEVVDTPVKHTAGSPKEPDQAAPPAGEAPEGAATASAPDETEGERWIREQFAETVEVCGEGDDEACRQLVSRLHFPSNDKEANRYLAVFEGACENGAPSACGAHGRFLYLKGDVEDGRAFMARGCEKQDGYSCAMLAEATLSDSETTPKERRQAEKTLAAHCEASGGWPCMTLALSLQKRGEKNKEKARGLMARGCRTGDPIACYESASTLEKKERPTEDEESEITEFYEKACQANLARACFNLAWRYLDGKGTPEDDARPLALALDACRLGDVRACDHLSRLDTEGKESTPEAEAVFVKYCDLWGGNACYNVAAHLVRRKGESDETAKALIRLSRTACLRGDVAGCNVLGKLAGDYIARCEKGEQVRIACTFAGQIHAVGIWLPEPMGSPVKADLEAAKDELTRACNSGSESACVERRRLETE